MGRYINPFTDWGFKRLFGQEFSKDLLINFLNDLFEGEFQIKDVTFKDKEQLGDSNDLRGCIFDIYCVTDDGKHFIVEMQNRWVPFFVNRSIYYASKAFVAQRKRFDEAGERTPVLYQFVPVSSLTWGRTMTSSCCSGQGAVSKSPTMMSGLQPSGAQLR